jgi:hypothetical protein
MTRLGRRLIDHPWLAYVVVAALSFPILEIIVHGESALQYAHDVFNDDVPRLFSIAADWRANGPVLWDPHLTAGNALLAQFALPPLAPDVLFSFVLTPFAAYALNAALMAFAAGVSMHLFLRDSLRLATVACFAGGILATLAFWHYIYGYAALALPLLLWSTDRALADGNRRRDVLVAVAVIAFLYGSSQVQIVLIDGVVVLAWVLATGSTGHSRLARVGGLAAVWVLATLLAAPVLASQVVAIPDSQRSIWDLAYLYPLGPDLEQVARLYGGILFGVPVTGGIGGSGDIYGSFFLGVLGLPLLVAGVVAPRRTGRERLLLVLLVAIPVVDVLALFAVPLQEHIALLRSFQFIRVRHLMPIALIVNAAIGLGWLAERDIAGRLAGLGRLRRIAGAIGLGGVGPALAWQGITAIQHVRHPTGSRLLREGWALGLVALVIGGIVLAAVAIAVTLRARRPALGGTAFVGAVVLVVVLGLTGERLFFARAERDLDGQLASWADRMALTPAQAFIASQAGGGRVLSIGEDANRALVAGLDAVDGYQTIYPLPYHDLFGAMIAPQLAVDPVRDRYFNKWGNAAFAFGTRLDMAVADLLGVRWLYDRGEPLADPGLTARFSGAGVTVYENPAVFPRAFIVHQLHVQPDGATVMAAIGAASVASLRSDAYLALTDLPSEGAPVVSDAPPNAADQATVESDTIDRIGIRTHTASPGILVLADTYTPDWVAQVDGASVPVLAADGALRGVALPGGDHHVTFSYRPIATYAGIVLALIAAAVLAGWLALGRRRRERATEPPATPPDRASAPPS